MVHPENKSENERTREKKREKWREKERLKQPSLTLVEKRRSARALFLAKIDISYIDIVTTQIM